MRCPLFSYRLDGVPLSGRPPGWQPEFALLARKLRRRNIPASRRTSQTSRCAASDQRKARAISSPAPYFHRAACRLLFRPTTLQRSRGVPLGQRSIPAAPQVHRTPLVRFVSRERLLFGVFELVRDEPQIRFPGRGTAWLSLLTVPLSSELPCEEEPQAPRPLLDTQAVRNSRFELGSPRNLHRHVDSLGEARARSWSRVDGRALGHLRDEGP